MKFHFPSNRKPFLIRSKSHHLLTTTEQIEESVLVEHLSVFEGKKNRISRKL